jgi:hypothetical protein
MMFGLCACVRVCVCVRVFLLLMDPFLLLCCPVVQLTNFGVSFFSSFEQTDDERKQNNEQMLVICGKKKMPLDIQSIKCSSVDDHRVCSDEYLIIVSQMECNE